MLSHFDAVLYYTGDDLLPQAVGQGVDSTNYRRVSGTALTGSVHLTTEGVRNAQMLRNYMNDGGKVIFSGRNGWVQQVGTGTGLNSYSGYSWWQEPVYGFNYPPDQAGDDDRPHTAFFRELDISNDWAQWFLGVGARQGGIGTTTYNAAAVTPSTGGLLAGMSPITLDTTAGAGDTLEPSQNAATGMPEARPKSPTRLRNISSITTQPRVPPGAHRGRLRRPDDRQRRRDHLHQGLRLDRVRPGADRRHRDPQRARAPHAGVPAADDRGHHRADGHVAASVVRAPPSSVADPVEVEVEAADDRGDIKEVRLSVNGQPVAKKVSFPFQLRWQPSASDIGLNTKLTATVEDKAGNVRTSDQYITVVAGDGIGDTPKATGATTDQRHAGGRLAADLLPVRLHGRRDHAVLRVAA